MKGSLLARVKKILSRYRFYGLVFAPISRSLTSPLSH